MRYCKSVTHRSLRKLHNEEFYNQRTSPFIVVCDEMKGDAIDGACGRHEREEKSLEGLVRKAEG